MSASNPILEDKSTLSNVRRMRIYISKKMPLPKLAHNLMRLNTLFQVLGDVPLLWEGMAAFKCVGVAFTAVASLIHKKQKKKVMKMFAQRKNEIENLSEEEVKFVDSLEDIDVTTKEFRSAGEKGIQELKDYFRKFKATADEALGILRKMYYLEGCSKIENQYKSLLDKSNKVLWANEFKNYKAEFESSLGDFTKPKLVQYLQKIYREQCKSSLTELYKTYYYLLECRSKYLMIMSDYYAHFPDSILKEIPDLDIVQEASNELLFYTRDVEILNEAMKEVSWELFPLLFKKADWKIEPVYVPKYEEIPENFLGVFTEQQLYGPEFSSRDKNEVYGPTDAMTSDTSNYIKIKQLFGDKQDHIVSIKSNLVEDCGRRCKFTGGGMEYGTIIYPRNERKGVDCRLYRFKSGRCDYDERIKENNEWKTTLKYTFNESTLTWIKRD